ncbi:MAG: Mur ligase family protein [Pseudomonadota bacterium]
MTPATAQPKALDEWLAFIGRVHPQAMELTLDRVATVAQRLGLLPSSATVITVAGTNGKGTTVLALEQLLLEAAAQSGAALTVGATLSPHLECFNERIRIQGELVSDAALGDAFAAIEAQRDGVPLTYFEYAALAALVCFRAADCDLIVLEIGLGGRLDAFNIVDADLAIITSIGLDHQAWLGDTREAIGAEKAGILRPGRPALFGPDMPVSVVDAARKQSVPTQSVGVDVVVESAEGCWRLAPGDDPWLRDPGLVLENCALALLAGRWVSDRRNDLAVTDRVLERWLAELAVPGRCEQRAYHGQHWLLDVGHNAEAAVYLASRLPDLLTARPTVAVFGCFADKPAVAIYEALAPAVGQWVLVPTGGPRGQGAHRLLDVLAQQPGVRHSAPSIECGLRTAAQLAGSQGSVLVLGGFEVIGRTRSWLSAGTT